MPVVPKYWGVDRDMPRLESGQRAMSAQVAHQRATADRGVYCGCQCCAAMRSPVAPGRGLCYACLRFRCQPSQEAIFAGQSYAQVDQQRLDWEGQYPAYYLSLAGEWQSEARPNKERPFGMRHYWQRFFVRRK